MLKSKWAGVEYGYAVAAVSIATGLCFVMVRFFALTNLVMVYLLATLIVAARGRRGPAALTSIVGVLAFDFFFVPPRWTLNVSDAQYLWTFLVMLATAWIISHLTIRLQTEARAARQGQAQTAKMHALTQHLANARGRTQVVAAAAHHVEQAFEGHVTAFLPNAQGSLELATSSEKNPLTDKDHGIAQWVFDQSEPAGLGTASLPDDHALYVPLKGTSPKANGVLRLQPTIPRQTLSPDQRRLLDSLTHQIGLALEVDGLQENTKRAEVEAETERLRSALLSSVSHDLRTPLAAILGSASALLEKNEILKSPPLQELVDNIETEGKRLTRLVQNLLEVTRLEGGAIKLQTDLTPLEEVVGSALESLKKVLQARTVEIDLPETLPLIPIDAVLIEQLLINLLENAARHTSPDSHLWLSAKADAHWMTVSLTDEGSGIEEKNLDHVFDKFFRGAASSGAGLGLAICKAIVQAHGGHIGAENRPGKGARFHFTLPLTSHD